MSDVTDVSVNWLELSPTLWITILINLHTDRDIRKRDIVTIMRFLSVCTTLHNFAHSDELWIEICKTLYDYDLILRNRKFQTNELWVQIYRERGDNLKKEFTFDVGVPREYTLTFRLYGDGICLRTDTRTERWISIYDDCPYAVQERIEGEFVDLEVNNPCVLLLCSDGRVLEMIYSPGYADTFKAYEEPVFVSFPSLQTDDRACMVSSLTIGNFAVTESGKLYVWSIIDHPTSMEKIRTEPLHITMLDEFPNKYDIEESPDNTEHTRLHYREYVKKDPMSGARVYDDKYLDLPNDQLYMMILSTCFTQEEFTEYASVFIDE
jgi:hypothetical protein